VIGAFLFLTMVILLLATAVLVGGLSYLLIVDILDDVSHRRRKTRGFFG
jgi:hypothetical protein